jgi:hypothetical protein
MSGALYNLADIMAVKGDVAEAAALLRQSFHSGLQNPDEIKSDKMLQVVVQTPGVVDDLVAQSIPRCETY